MPSYDQNAQVFITCPKMLTPYLTQELNQEGFEISQTSAAGVRIEANLFDCMKLNLRLRTAHRILYPLFSGKAKNLDELYSLCYDFNWADWIPLDGQFSVHHTARQVDVDNTQMINLKAKDAIADRFVADLGKRPNSGKAEKAVIVSIHWAKDQVKVYIDTSGESLNRRGYKVDNWKASLQESLAAAIAMEANIGPNTRIHNPMCGSGTLAFEALMIQHGIWPGIKRREYAIMYIKDFPEDLWGSLRRIHKHMPLATAHRLYASDRSTGAIRAARKNAKKLGVDEFIYWEVCPFNKAKIAPDEPGIERLFLFNPPYGQRLGEEEGLNELYRKLGKFLKFDTAPSKALIISSQPKLLEKIGLKAAKTQELYNSTLPVYLHTYEMFKKE
jgi:putative N6-adenine-specific DNA methylase